MTRVQSLTAVTLLLFADLSIDEISKRDSRVSPSTRSQSVTAVTLLLFADLSINLISSHIALPPHHSVPPLSFPSRNDFIPASHYINIITPRSGVSCRSTHCVNTWRAPFSPKTPITSSLCNHGLVLFTPHIPITSQSSRSGGFPHSCPIQMWAPFTPHLPTTFPKSRSGASPRSCSVTRRDPFLPHITITSPYRGADSLHLHLPSQSGLRASVIFLHLLNHRPADTIMAQWKRLVLPLFPFSTRNPAFHSPFFEPELC
ncbi:hypothetical protein BDZ45DRAFT_89012 [Acephala macrosclerotiorum]|nr:hypothetical protein BDZ45DRAFT_89012 [Acephala macrosclerotiorum]